ncbi:MAG TPA: hypothetical protein VHW67_07140 [Solirubrobacteraceae bacterium]|jgi:hypothetical protein|nr:hypothetical protein [Solirubrobacteraceae bacterium]
MRQISRAASLLALCVALALTAALGAATAGAKGQSSFKVGAYKGTVGPQKISFTVKRARCGGKTQLCVTLSKAPTSISCTGPAAEGGGPFGPLTTTVALPSSGKVSAATPVSEKIYPPPANLRETKQTGFTATFTKKGTVSGFFEMHVVQIEEGGSSPCTGKEAFKAKLG